MSKKLKKSPPFFNKSIYSIFPISNPRDEKWAPKPSFSDIISVNFFRLKALFHVDLEKFSMK